MQKITVKKANPLRSCIFLFSVVFAVTGNNAFSQNLLNWPESVAYDETTGLYYVTNTGDGGIVEVNAAGNQRMFNNSQLGTSCRGIHRIDTNLYAACDAGVVEVDLATGTTTAVVVIPGGDFINDITADANGLLYVSDGGVNSNVVYQVNPADQTVVNFANVNGPNGLFFDAAENRLLVTTDGQIHSINLDDASVTPVVNTGHLALDGLTRDHDGNLYFSTWLSNAVYRFDPDFNLPAQLVQGNIDGPADIFFNLFTNELVIPVFNDNQLDILLVTPPPPVTLDAPTNGAVDVPVTTTLTWVTSPSADQYHLQVSTLPDFSTLVIDDQTLTLPTADVGPLAGETVHYWRARGINTMGIGVWSPTWSFTSARANTIPNVVNVIGDIEMLVGGPDRDISLINVFNDDDGDDLSYSATSSNESVATVSINGSDLTVSAVSVGTASITVTADDGFGGSVQAGFDVSIPSGVANERDSELPTAYSLDNYPNPFNPATTIVYTVPRAGFIEISIHDLAGRLIAIPVSSEHVTGQYEVHWDATLHASGLYVYTLTASNFRVVSKMLLMK